MSHHISARAVVVREPGAPPEVEDITVAPPDFHEVIVRIAASGVCATDALALRGETALAKFPLVLGHEGAGVVEAVGPGVDSCAPGDHVVLALSPPCGSCQQCRAGNPVHCGDPESLRKYHGIADEGTSRVRLDGREAFPFAGLGTLATHVNVPQHKVIVIDADLPLADLCLTGCGVLTGYGAVTNTAGVRPGQSVAVVGCGGVGLNVIQTARLAGATTVIAIDPVPFKRNLAQNFGATHVVNPGTESMGPAVRAVVRGGVDIAFEVVGNPELIARTLELTRIGGTCVMVGAPPAGATIPVPRDALMLERRLLGCRVGSTLPARDLPVIAALYRQGSLRLHELISARLALDDFGQALAALHDGSAARSIITFDQ